MQNRLVLYIRIRYSFYCFSNKANLLFSEQEASFRRGSHEESLASGKRKQNYFVPKNSNDFLWKVPSRLSCLPLCWKGPSCELCSRLILECGITRRSRLKISWCIQTFGGISGKDFHRLRRLVQGSRLTGLISLAKTKFPLAALSLIRFRKMGGRKIRHVY